MIIVIALFMTLIMVVTRRDVGYSLVIIWALTGITANQMANPIIVTTLEASIIVILIVLVVMILITRFLIKPKLSKN